MKIGVYPGSFDPITNGHLDIIERALSIFDVVHVSVLKNNSKNAFFSVEERLEFLKRSTAHLNNVIIDSFDGLLAQHAENLGASAIIRGLRAVSDFEYEFKLAAINSRLVENVETVFLMTSIQYSFLSSNIVKEVATYGGNIEGLVPDCILSDVKSRLLTK